MTVEDKKLPDGLVTDQLARKIHVCYPEGRTRAFTLSYDDGNDCDAPLVEMMRKYGVKGTFNLNSAMGYQWKEEKLWRRMSMEECVSLYGEDMEIAVHGALHSNWTQLSTADAMVDILDDRRNLERVTGKIIRGAAYPFGSYNKYVAEILRLADIQYCRTCGDTGKTKLKDMPNWLKLRPTCHHNDPRLMEIAQKFLKGTGNNTLHLFYVWGHSYEFVQDNNWDVMEQLLSSVSGREDVWYATNIEIVEYLKASQCLIYNLDQTLARNPTDIDLWIKITPANQAVKIPAGVTMELPL